jgi:anti-anti-sigma factor
MEITRQKTIDLLVIRLAGRLDASWSGAVQKEFDAAVRKGEHRIHLDMAMVDYISSAGLGALLTLYKELHAIKGHFGICAASPFVQSALEMAGLSSLISKPQETAEPAPQKGRTAESPKASYEIFSTDGRGVRVSLVGDPNTLEKGSSDSQKFTFGKNAFALGIGSLGGETDGCETRFGEFLAVAGSAVYQPVDGANRPDFLVSEGDLVPEGRLLLGLHGEGDFPTLARFEAKAESRTVGLTELALTALEFSQTPAAVIVAVTETAGLAGTALRQSPAPAETGDRFGFPQIREWLAFSNERVFRDSSSLIVGVVAREGSPLQPLLRPLAPGVLGHFHAAAFPYHPLQKGLVGLQPTVATLFQGNTVSAVLHLLADNREFNGAGESEFLRGALWIAPIDSAIA